MSSIKDKAKGLFGDILSADEQEEILGVNPNEEVIPEPNPVDYIVYFKGDRPDTVWEYMHNPEDGIPTLDDAGNQEIDEHNVAQYDSYGRLYGYWSDPDEQGVRQFEEHKSNNLKLMDFDTFMDNVVPNRECTKIFESEADFLLELI
ncbi:MAG: hypothetical protein GY861_25140 [bacterium]|nr:hypothetical protein [bacterium]